MNRAFADMVYWIARINPRDQWHATYRAVSGLNLVTTDEVLDEVLAHFSAFGPTMGQAPAPPASSASSSPTRTSRSSLSPGQSFLDGLTLCMKPVRTRSIA